MGFLVAYMQLLLSALPNLLVFRRRGCEEEELCELVMYSEKIRFVLL